MKKIITLCLCASIFACTPTTTKPLSRGMATGLAVAAGLGSAVAAGVGSHFLLNYLEGKEKFFPNMPEEKRKNVKLAIGAGVGIVTGAVAGGLSGAVLWYLFGDDWRLRDLRALIRQENAPRQERVRAAKQLLAEINVNRLVQICDNEAQVSGSKFQLELDEIENEFSMIKDDLDVMRNLVQDGQENDFLQEVERLKRARVAGHREFREHLSRQYNIVIK